MGVPDRRNAVCRLTRIIILSAVAAAAQTPPQPPVAAEEWLPAGALYTLRIEQPAALLDLAVRLNPSVLQMVSPSGKGEQGLQQLVDMLAKRSGTDVKGLIRNLTAGGITYAMYPGENAVWVFDASDGQMLGTLQQLVHAIAGAQRLASPVSAKPAGIFYQEYPGDVAAWSFDGKQFFARSGNRLVLASRGEVLKSLFGPRTQASLASSPLYTEARRAVTGAGQAPAAWAFVNLAVLKQAPPIRKGLALGGDPVDVLLNGGWKQALRDARWVGATVRLGSRNINVRLITDGKLAATGAGAFTLPEGSGVLPNLTVPRQLAAMTLWRDLGKFYAEKEMIFPRKTSGGILAENFMEIFFTGRNLTDEVFGKIQPQVRLVVARQEFDPKIGTPEAQFPAAALVFRTDPRTAEDFGEVMEEAWQKAVGLTNFTRGQQALSGVILDRETHGGITFTYGRFSVRGEKDREHLPVRFNLRPAIVRDGRYLILSTTDGLACDLIGAINREDGRNPQPGISAHTVVEVNNPAEIASLLRANKPAMVRQSVLTGGKKPGQAAHDFDQNVSWLDRLGRVELSVLASELDLAVELK